MIISHAARKRFGLEEIFLSEGFKDIAAKSKKHETAYEDARQLAGALNRANRTDLYPDHFITPASVYALSLIHRINCYLIQKYAEQQGAPIFQKLMGQLEKQPGKQESGTTFEVFVSNFPPKPVFSGSLSAADFIQNAEEKEKEALLRELILLWITNKNQAAVSMRDLFSDAEMKHRTAYKSIISGSYLFFSHLPGAGPGNLNLIDLLRSPALAHPDSLLKQLQYVRSQWGELLGDFADLLLRGIDYLREEERPVFPPGPGPSEVPDFTALEELERFSSDSHWMPEVVLIAKSSLVWLDQLSRQYRSEIRRLDQIPDRELDILAGRGFNALWLIGLWERSKASRRIKQWSGNPEAAASAYSLRRYEIAEELGGWDALSSLRDRCRSRGIRLASDMVPNHTGLDSDWLYEHPEWFIQSPEPPYPNYRYHGESLVDRQDCSVQIEDHYWDRTDAAVTFKFNRHHEGPERYIYHGNDGTSMPWNDTAQLDYLNPEVREVVIRTIIHVAKNFPIIRFDAAMTLAKKHIQRLWYPKPGHGGDIPSRSRFGLSDKEFNRRMPEEFWREVVDRVAEEAPETLLLAEAFWMMEGYFVRTLGMHRVYNSAFMNMLKNEENEKYKITIKSTLEYDPEILKRFVNFMNNPDEDTAYAQFGDGDKYFGVCTMMAAMPGLPMFGHGQIEGFREKYGMEYRKAYMEESPDEHLVRRHEREIFPLTRMRHLFAEVDNFFLYDFIDSHGGINENVFVWSNRKGDTKALMAFNNSYHSCHGSFNQACPVNRKNPAGDRFMESGFLSAGLDLRNQENWFTIFREQRSNLWFIRENRTLHHHGMELMLSAYQTQVFLDFYQVEESDGSYRQLLNHLSGAGVPDIQRLRRELIAAPAREPFSLLISPERIRQLTDSLCGKSSRIPALLKDTIEDYRRFLLGCRSIGYGSDKGVKAALEEYKERMLTLEQLAQLGNIEDKPLPGNGAGYYLRGLTIMQEAPVLLYSRALLAPLQLLLEPDAAEGMIRELLLPDLFDDALRSAGVPDDLLYEPEHLIPLLVRLDSWIKLEYDGSPAEALKRILSIPEAASFCGINEHAGVRWYKGETMQQLLWWLAILAMPDTSEKAYSIARQWSIAESGSDYRLDRLLELLKGGNRGR